MHSPVTPRRAGDPQARIVILGTDTMLAALPATSVQIAHACRAAGFDVAIPASWGDELVADACLRELGTREGTPVIQCSCPCVARRLATDRGELEGFLLALDSPPIAAARYVRALYTDTTVHVTYAGACPSGADPLIDRHLDPAAFLAELASLGISLGDQPAIFESILPPDRRRHRSLPGGCPSPEALLDERGRRLVEISTDGFSAELAEQLLAHQDVLIDVAPRLGCACSGSVNSITAGNARSVVASLEPPRSPTPVVDGRFRNTSRPTPRDVAIIPDHELVARFVRPAGDEPRQAAEPRPGIHTPDTGWRLRARPFEDDPVRRPPLLTPRSSSATVPIARRADGAPLPRTYALTRAVSGRYRAVPAPDASAVAPRDTRDARAEHAPSIGEILGLTSVGVAVATPPMSHLSHQTPVEAAAQPVVAGVEEAAGEDAPVPEPQSPSAPVHVEPVHRVPDPASPAPDAAADRHPLMIEAEFDAFMAEIRETVAETVAEWRLSLRASITAWRAAGYATVVLERALALPREPDVAGLLDTYRAAVDHLRTLEARALALAPHLVGSLQAHPVFRDPARIADAEAVVQRLTTPPSHPAATPDSDETPLTLVWDWITIEDRVIEELGPDALAAASGWTSRRR